VGIRISPGADKSAEQLRHQFREQTMQPATLAPAMSRAAIRARMRRFALESKINGLPAFPRMRAS